MKSAAEKEGVIFGVVANRTFPQSPSQLFAAGTLKFV